MMRHASLSTIPLIVLLQACGGEPAATRITSAAHRDAAPLQLGLAPGELAILQQAYSAMFYQRDLGNLAYERGLDEGVRQFGHKVAEISEGGIVSIAQLAMTKGDKLTACMTPEMQRSVAEVFGKGRDSFDAAYMAAQLNRLDSALIESQDAVLATRTGDVDVHAFAERSVPEIKALLEEAHRVDADRAAAAGTNGF